MFSSFSHCLQIERLDGQLRGKDEELARLRQLHSEEVARLSEELRSLRDSYEAKIREYEELMDIKIQLDQEIATYRALLQEEETRFVGSLAYGPIPSFSVLQQEGLLHYVT